MSNFYAYLWPWLAACLATGAATAALVPSDPARRAPARWLIWAALAFVAAALALALGALRGDVSIHVESALGCFAAFMLGCVGGAFGLRRNLAAHERWALGLVPAGLLWWGAAHLAQPAYQADLERRVAALVQAAGADPSGLSISGRDVVAAPAIAGDEALTARIAAPGVRRIVAVRTTETERAPDSPAAPPPNESKVGESKTSESKTSEVKSDATATIAPASPDQSTDILASPPAGPLDAAACQRALDAVAAAEPAAFRAARATVNRRVAAALDKAAEIIRRCPDATIEVRGHGDDGGVEDSLSRRRARAAERYLRREGVGSKRLVATGCCARAAPSAGAIDYILR